MFVHKEQHNSMRLSSLMSQPPVTCGPQDSLNAAARLMWERDLGAIPVVNESGALIGMLTDRDICMAAYTEGDSLESIPVANAMAKLVFSCHQGDSLEAAELVMRERQVRRVPIVDGDNRPVGLLSLGDIARSVGAMRKRSGLLEHELTRTISAICQPRPAAEQGRMSAQKQTSSLAWGAGTSER